MPTIIDNVELDETNIEFNNASDFIKHTDRLVYLTGKAGTGKTTFLKYLKQTTNKNTVIVAPTGVAAINAGGQTIHSFFQIKPSVYVPNDKRLRTRIDEGDTDRSTIYDHFKYFKERLEIIKGLELLIIDEISMVRCDLLDVIDRLLRVFRKREFELFGGVQVILIGDTFQLPPIADFEQWEILNKFYESPFFFSSKVIKENKPIYIELKKIYRQNEQEFIDLLNRVRVNQITQNELTVLNSKYNPTFTPNESINYITLATHNRIVDSTNLTKLSELTTELKLFEAVTTGTFPDNIMPTDRVLQLKEGSQIMFIKNDKQLRRYYNGIIGKVTKIEEGGIFVTYSNSLRNEEQTITVEKEIWNNIKYSWNEDKKKIEEDVIGTFTQFPVRLAWAITVHKSQGLTFEKVIADLGSAFTSGQVYVALSRCTSFNGLVLKTRIDRNAIKTDPEVLTFAQNETPSTLIIQELNAGKADFYYKRSREAIRSVNYLLAIDSFTTAIKYRNDIETEIFKRYFVTILSRLNSHKTLASRLADQIADANKVNFELQNDKQIQEQKITEQNKAIKILLDKTKELEKINDKNGQLITSLRNEIKLLSDNLTLRQIKSGKQEVKINEYETTIRRQQEEIERLQNLKWYQKLMGDK
jgi:hypothetical protein